MMMGLMHFMKSKMMVQMIASKKLPFAGLVNVLTGLLLLGGGVSLITGRYLEYSILGLAVFLLLAAFIFHNFWADKDAGAKMANMSHFLKNIALGSAILMLHGSMAAWPWVLA